jgi:hypothetical protein
MKQAGSAAVLLSAPAISFKRARNRSPIRVMRAKVIEIVQFAGIFMRRDTPSI